jgi:AraC-like DNA-binding protein
MVSIQTYTSAKLSAFIKSFWHLEVIADTNKPYTEEILPDCHHEIIFTLTAPLLRKKQPSENWSSDPRFYFTGQNSKSYSQLFKPGTIMYGIRFHPHTQHLFFNFPAILSTDNLIPVEDVAEANRIQHCFSESPSRTFLNLEQEFTKRAYFLKHPENSFFYVEAAVKEIIKTKGNLKRKQIEKVTGVSSRYLEKSFLTYVGLSPKQFSNIIKFGNFVTYRKNNPQKTLTECAYETSFYDQSHLIHLSNQITNLSPKHQFLQENHINNLFLQS